jgi:hypothetical protein
MDHSFSTGVVCRGFQASNVTMEKYQENATDVRSLCLASSVRAGTVCAATDRPPGTLLDTTRV